MFPSRKLGRTSRTSTVRLTTDKVRPHAKDKPCNCSYHPSGDVSGVSYAIGMDTHFVLGNGKSMRISSVGNVRQSQVRVRDAYLVLDHVMVKARK